MVLKLIYHRLTYHKLYLSKRVKRLGYPLSPFSRLKLMSPHRALLYSGWLFKYTNSDNIFIYVSTSIFKDWKGQNISDTSDNMNVNYYSLTQSVCYSSNNRGVIVNKVCSSVSNPLLPATKITILFIKLLISCSFSGLYEG